MAEDNLGHLDAVLLAQHGGGVVPQPVGVPAAGLPPAPGKAEAAELARLKGAWRAVRLQVGKKARELPALERTLDLQADRWTMKHPDGTGTGKARLDLNKVPHRRD